MTKSSRGTSSETESQPSDSWRSLASSELDAEQHKGSLDFRGGPGHHGGRTKESEELGWSDSVVRCSASPSAKPARMYHWQRRRVCPFSNSAIAGKIDHPKQSACDLMMTRRHIPPQILASLGTWKRRRFAGSPSCRHSPDNADCLGRKCAGVKTSRSGSTLVAYQQVLRLSQKRWLATCPAPNLELLETMRVRNCICTTACQHVSQSKSSDVKALIRTVHHG